MSDKTLHVDLRVGETLVIGGARVRLEQKSGQRARLSITAPPGMRVDPPVRASAPGMGAMLASRGVMPEEG